MNCEEYVLNELHLSKVKIEEQNERIKELEDRALKFWFQIEELSGKLDFVERTLQIRDTKDYIRCEWVSSKYETEDYQRLVEIFGFNENENEAEPATNEETASSEKTTGEV